MLSCNIMTSLIAFFVPISSLCLIQENVVVSSINCSLFVKEIQRNNAFWILEHSCVNFPSRQIRFGFHWSGLSNAQLFFVHLFAVWSVMMDSSHIASHLCDWKMYPAYLNKPLHNEFRHFLPINFCSCFPTRFKAGPVIASHSHSFTYPLLFYSNCFRIPLS